MPIRVLLADDHKGVREALRALLRGQMEIELIGEAEDGLSAVGMARELKPDVVVIDVSMPGLSGTEATGQIRGLEPRPGVVALSAHGDAQVAAKMLEAGAGAYVLKDRAFEELVPAILGVVGGKRFVSPDVERT